MKPSDENGRIRGGLDEVRLDGKRWRRLVSRCMHTEDWIPPATDEQYKVIHGRILATCRNLAEGETVPEFRRRVARELDELLRPWSSAKALADAPPNLVEDLVKKEASLEERLRGKRAPSTARRLMKLAVIACLAGAVGIGITSLLDWMSSDASRGFTDSLLAMTTSIAARIRGSSFTEQFAVAVLLSWALGTWLLSNGYKS